MLNKQYIVPNSTYSFIKQNIPLHDKNWFQTGGCARYFSAPTTAQEFQESLTFAHTHNLDVFILGKGANILISDAGFDGLVIQPQLTSITLQPVDATTTLVTAGAGVEMPALIEYCLNHNIIG